GRRECPSRAAAVRPPLAPPADQPPTRTATDAWELPFDRWGHKQDESGPGGDCREDRPAIPARKPSPPQPATSRCSTASRQVALTPLESRAPIIPFGATVGIPAPVTDFVYWSGVQISRRQNRCPTTSRNPRMNRSVCSFPTPTTSSPSHHANPR